MTTTANLKRLDLSDLRYWYQNAKMAVRDIFDAITELVTNADDAYARESVKGRIDIEIERRRKGTPSVLRVRDFAGGIAPEHIDEKLSRLGSRRNSGMADGASVRGTNSRGAKDVAVLGMATFESIDADGRYARRQINARGAYIGEGRSQPVTKALREQTGISKGGGLLVTIEVDSSASVQIPQHENLVKKLQALVSLRDILHDPDREVYLTDSTQQRQDRVQYHAPDGTERVCGFRKFLPPPFRKLLPLLRH